MPPRQRLPAHLLNIYLVKESIEKMEEALIKVERLKPFDLSRACGAPATLWIQHRSARVPRWASFFATEVPSSAFGRVSSAAAVLTIHEGGRIFALAFGQGRYLIDAESIEQRFGLKACLNSIDENNIRSIDKRSFDALLTHSRIQTSKAAPIAEFGLDLEQDLLRGAIGKPTDAKLGERMHGIDSLAVAVRASLQDLHSLLPQYLKKSRETRYRRKFPWVEQIAEVLARAEITQLDKQLLARIADGSRGSTWMAIPEIVDWRRIDGFRHSRSRKALLRFDIHLDEWKEDALGERELTIDFLRDSKIRASNTDGEDVESWSAYRCLTCEIEDGKDTYVLSNGKWYRVKRDLVAQVNEFFDSVSPRESLLPPYVHDSESAYNQAVARMHPNEFSCHDFKLVTVPSSGSPIEICDLYSVSGELIHVKRYGASSVLSHHFAQAAISAQVLCSDREARKLFTQQVSAPFVFRDDPFRPSEHPIVIAIISDRDAALTLPFFARLNFKNSVSKIRGMGYEVRLAKIMTNDVKKRTRKAVSRGRRRLA